jgi:photosystem II stability/assembly factor-like uncharacterized protein
MKKIILVKLILLFLVLANLLYSQEYWQSIGPEGGNVSKLKAAPSNRLIVYSGMRDGSVFTSANGGQSWNLIAWFAEGTSTLDIQSNNSQIVYLGTNRHLYKTTDGGVNWVKTDWAGNGINSITIDQTDPQNIYLSSYSDYGGIWISRDSGNNWIFSSFGTEFGISMDICVMPDSNNVIYSSHSDYLYRSSDFGETWSLISEFSFSPLDLEIDPQNSSILYLATNEGVYKSTDGGYSWSEKNAGDINTDHPWTENVMVDPFNSDNVIRTNNHNWTSYLSTNKGGTWKEIELPAGSPTFVSDSILLSGTRDGIYSWNNQSEVLNLSSDGLHGTTIKSISTTSGSSLKVFAVSEDQGIGEANLYIWENGTEMWDKTFWGNGVSNIAVSPFDNNIIIGGFGEFNSGINISIDGGRNWTEKEINDNVRVVSFSSYDSSTIFAGGLYGLQKSSDLGESWTEIPIPSSYHTLDQLSVENNDSLIFIGLDRGVDWNRERTLISSFDGGQTWQDHNLKSNSILIYPHSSNIIFCGTTNSLYKSTNYGANWSNLNVFDTSLYIHKIAIYKGAYIFLGTESGIYFSKDIGSSWKKVSEDLLYTNIIDIDFLDYPKPTIVISSKGGGIQKKYIDDITSVQNIKNIPNEFSLSNNYPNPFNASTRIYYSIPFPSNVSIKVFDILGREIKTLLDERKAQGKYRLDINLSDYPSGVYFIKMTSKEYFRIKKILLLK